MTTNPPPFTASRYQPEEASFAARVLQLLGRNPEEYYTSRDLGTKLDLDANKVYPLLQPALQHDLVAWVLPEGERTKVWRAGANLSAWHALRQQEQAIDAQTLPTKRSGRGGRQVPLPPLLPSQVEIHTGREKPLVTRGGPGGTRVGKYQWIFDQLHAKPVGASAVLPHLYLGTLTSLAKKRQKAGLGRYTVRRINLTSMEIWRDA